MSREKLTIRTSEAIKSAILDKRVTYRGLAKSIPIDHAFLHNIASEKKPPPQNKEFYESLSNALDIDKEQLAEYLLMVINENIKHDLALIKKVYKYVLDNQTVNVDSRKQGLQISVENFQAFLDGEPLNLTYKEFQLLAYLYNNPNRTITREALLSQVWGFDYFGGTRTVDVHIRRLRAKLEPRYHDHIETVRNIGYRFIAKKFTFM